MVNIERTRLQKGCSPVHALFVGIHPLTSWVDDDLARIPEIEDEHDRKHQQEEL